MNVKTIATFWLLLLILSMSLSACGPPETPIPESELTITNIVENNEVKGQITQTKIFNQCAGDSGIKAQIGFNRSSGQTNQKELVLGAGVSGQAGISVAAQVKVEASIEQHFATINTTAEGYQEVISIEVPARAQQEYTLIWQETRREGTIEYIENGEKKFTNYSYRIGLEFASSNVKDISCLVTVTASPTLAPPTQTQTPNPEPIATNIIVVEKFFADACIPSQTWEIVSTDQDTLNNIATKSDGCYDTGSLGVFPDKIGVLHILDGKRRASLASGIYTSINNDSVIEFKVHVSSMFIVNSGTPVYINFAIAPSSDPITTKDTTRFKLQVDDNKDSPLIYFVLADVGENNGAKLDSQHYEYGRTYTIRFKLTGSVMSIFINDVKLNENLSIPTGAKVFYIGYSLPAYANIEVEVTNITIDGVLK